MIQMILFLFLSHNAWSEPTCTVGTTMDHVKNCVRKLTVRRLDTGSGASPRIITGVGIVGNITSPCPEMEEVIEVKKVQDVEVEVEKLATLENLAPEFKQKGADCRNFINSNNGATEYGPWGKEVISYIEEQGAESIFMNSDLGGMSSGVAACPNWKNMSADKKNHFWVWVMASISHVESTCMPFVRNGAGTNGVATGLLQMDERLSNRNWRGPNCKVASVNEPASNIRCGLDILGQLIEGENGMYRSNGELWGRGTNSYWQHLRTEDGGGISSLIKLNPYCN